MASFKIQGVENIFQYCVLSALPPSSTTELWEIVATHMPFLVSADAAESFTVSSRSCLAL
jgi:hypothetical protein